MSDMAHVGGVIGIRMPLRLKKFIGEALELSEGEQQSFVKLQRDAVERGEAVVEALRTFKKGRLALTGFLRVEDRNGRGGASGFGGGAPGASWWGDYELGSDEASDFASFWSTFQEAKTRKLVDGSIRRLSYAADRHRPDDRLVDLVIAAEALFLGDAGDPQVRTELRYRYSLRAAFFVEVEGRSRTEMFRFMRNTYDARSAIVHGGEPDSKLLISLDGSALTLAEYADAVEEVVRVALRKAIANLPSAGGPLVDWDTAILEGGAA